MVVRGIRGAITVAENTKEAVKDATVILIQEMVKANDLLQEDIASAFFTVTEDINAEFPAYVARIMGWDYVPMLCTTEISVPGSLAKTIRILLHVNTNKTQREIKHIYLRDAIKLRPDIN